MSVRLRMCEEQIVRNKGEAKEGLRWKHVEETDNLVIVNKSDEIV